MVMVDANGSRITPAIAKHLMAQLAMKFGPYIYDWELWAEMHPSQIIEWENCGLEVQQIKPPWKDLTQLPPKTFMGLPLESNPHLSPSVVLIRKQREIVGEIGRLGLTRWDMEEVNA